MRYCASIKVLGMQVVDDIVLKGVGSTSKTSAREVDGPRKCGTKRRNECESIIVKQERRKRRSRTHSQEMNGRVEAV